MMSSYSLLFMHHVADNSCFHPQIPPPFEAHTLLLSMAHSGERKSPMYSCTPVSKLLSQSSLSAPGVSGEIEKKSVFTMMMEAGGEGSQQVTISGGTMHTSQVLEFPSSILEK